MVTSTVAAVDPGSVETVAVTLTAELSGDQETLTLTETGAATGVFEGTIELSVDPAASFNGVLETSGDPGPPARFDTLQATYTDAGGGTSSATATTSGSLTWFIDAYGAVTDIFAYNSTAYVRVEDQNFNQPAQIDTVTATITVNATGTDTETITLTEVDATSGIFEGAIDLEYGPVVPGDGVLQAANNRDIEVVHDDALGFSQSSAQATVVQGTVWWIDDAGLPVSELEENGVGRVRVLSPLENFIPTVVEGSNVEIWTLWSGDSELVTLLETGPDTGVFEATIDLDFVPSMGGATPMNGVIETTHNGAPEYQGEQVTARTALTYTAVATVIASRVSFVDLLSQPVSTYALGATVRVRIVDHNLNFDSGIVDDFVVPVVSQLTGDVEDVTVSELGPDSGVFEQSLATTDLGTGSQDGTLSVQVGDVIEVTHFNANVPTVNTAQAAINGNLPPLAVDDDAFTVPDQAVVIDVLANDSDPELGALVVAGASQGADGGVVVNGDDTVTYTPNPAFVGVDVFTYVVEDAGGGQSQATVTVTINSCSANRSLAAGQWALISPPCDPVAAGTVADVFGDDLLVGDYGDRWGVFDYNAVAQRYLLLALTDSLAAGEGYWIITYDSGRTIDTGGVAHAVTTVPLVADAAAGRSNLVGHPFLSDVCWADVEVIDGASVLTLAEADPVIGVQRACSMEPPDPSCVMSRIAYGWTGSAYASFDGVTPGAEGTLSSFEGLWVKAFKAGIGLRIPARESTSCSVLKTAGPPLKSSDGEWLVRLSAESGPLRDGSAVIGQLGAGADGYDRHDLPKLEAEEDRDLLAIVFPRQGWGTRAGDYATDFHAVKPDGQADDWEFEVRSSAPGLEVTLRWEGPEWALAGASLIDEVSGRPVTVQPDGSYTFRMRGTRHPFRWQMR
ncbi:MAG: hypothetical protein GY856_45820 [bacterium]|nr:hypothetical protein [bacterium]